MNTKKKEISKTLIKSLFGAVPYIGTMLDEVFFEYRSRVRQERLNQFVEAFKEYIEVIDIGEIDIDNLKSEEFVDVLESILKSVANNRNKSKVEYFKKILANQIKQDSYNDFTETYLDIISKLNEIQIRILKNHYEIRKPIKELELKQKQLRNDIRQVEENIVHLKFRRLRGDQSRIGRNRLRIAQIESEIKEIQDLIDDKGIIRNAKYYDLKQGEYLFYIQDLVSKSLLIDKGIGKMDSKPYQLMTISDFGRSFLEFLEYKG